MRGIHTIIDFCQKVDDYLESQGKPARAVDAFCDWVDSLPKFSEGGEKKARISALQVDILQKQLNSIVEKL